MHNNIILRQFSTKSVLRRADVVISMRPAGTFLGKKMSLCNDYHHLTRRNSVPYLDQVHHTNGVLWMKRSGKIVIARKKIKYVKTQQISKKCLFDQKAVRMLIIFLLKTLFKICYLYRTNDFDFFEIYKCNEYCSTTLLSNSRHRREKYIFTNTFDKT